MVNFFRARIIGSWIEQRRYGDIATQLPAVLNVLQLFGSYMEVEHVKNVAEQLERLKQRLAIQLVADMKRAFQVKKRGDLFMGKFMCKRENFVPSSYFCRLSFKVNRISCVDENTYTKAGDVRNYNCFQSGALNSSVTDMCRVASSLGPAVREDFCRWFIEHQLSEYAVLYGESESSAWIDKIDMRLLSCFIYKFSLF